MSASQYVKITEAARCLGLSVDTVRRRIRRGELDAVQMQTRAGQTWHVWLEPQRFEPSESAPAERRDLSDLVLLVSRLQAENADLAGRVGWLEAELQNARAQIKTLGGQS